MVGILKTSQHYSEICCISKHELKQGFHIWHQLHFKSKSQEAFQLLIWNQVSCLIFARDLFHLTYLFHLMQNE